MSKVKNISGKIKIQLVKSLIGRLPNHLACVRGLGLKTIRQTALLDNTPAILGMVNKVSYLLKVEFVEE